MPEKRIFIQIASYRDPQLPATLRDCISRARNPSHLHFCIAHQYDENEDVSEFETNHPSGADFTFIRIPYQDSNGACWARNLIQQHYRGEAYTLQLDSHHRFADDWDLTCIEMLMDLQAKGFPKPLLTAYLPSFDPEADPDGRIHQAWRMNFDRFTPEGVVFFRPGEIPHWRDLSDPVPARFFSAHFTFTLGQHCIEVAHDPEYYFHGEEISLAVRSYTHGYDLFHPHLLVAWHEYTRKGRTKHWDDDRQWHVRNSASLRRNRCLLGVDRENGECEFGRYGLGNVRTLAQYEIYAGVRFADRAVQHYTIADNPPPNPRGDAWTNPLLLAFTLTTSFPRDRVPENDYDFWCIVFHDEKGQDIYREDANSAEINRILATPDPSSCHLQRSFKAPRKPVRCIVWPHSARKGWCPQIQVEEWEEQPLQSYTFAPSIPCDRVAENDYDFWCVAFHDEEALELYREDAGAAEIARLTAGAESGCTIHRTFKAPKRPVRCVVWPHSASKGWCPRIDVGL